MNIEKVSVVINSYRNDANELIRAIRSYVEQNGVDVEVIVSTVKGDNAVIIAKQMGVKLVINEKPGIYEQLNAALNEVTGKWFCYASGNDVAVPGKLFDEVSICRDSDKLVCYSAFHVIEAGRSKVRKFHDYDYEKHLKGNFVSDCALMHRSILAQYKPFKTQYGNHAFLDFWLRVFEGEGDVFVYNKQPTWKYRISKKSAHVIRKQDADKIKINEVSRDRMLKAHK